jgi:hypothetical protein
MQSPTRRFKSESGTGWHERCQILHKTTQPVPEGTGCVMETLSYCLRDTGFSLSPTPGTKTHQRHKPRPEENHRRR